MGGLAEVLGFQAPVLAGAVLLIALWLWASSRRDAMASSLEGD
jgi:hypothetical protein